MSNFEKKFGKYAVSNLSLKLVILYVIGYVLYYVKPDIFSLLVLDVTALAPVLLAAGASRKRQQLPFCRHYAVFLL